MLVRGVSVDPPPAEGGAWPYTVPCVAQLAGSGLTLERPVTFLVGENGSGKSTLVEGIAEAYGLHVKGGRAGRKYGDLGPSTPLGQRLRLGAAGAQVICATHSPFLASVPGADIVEVNEAGSERTAWDELDLVDRWRRYLGNPSAYLRHLIDADADDDREESV